MASNMFRKLPACVMTANERRGYNDMNTIQQAAIQARNQLLCNDNTHQHITFLGHQDQILEAHLTHAKLTRNKTPAWAMTPRERESYERLNGLQQAGVDFRLKAIRARHCMDEAPVEVTKIERLERDGFVVVRHERHSRRKRFVVVRHERHSRRKRFVVYIKTELESDDENVDVKQAEVKSEGGSRVHAVVKKKPADESTESASESSGAEDHFEMQSDSSLAVAIPSTGGKRSASSAFGEVNDSVQKRSRRM